MIHIWSDFLLVSLQFFVYEYGRMVAVYNYDKEQENIWSDNNRSRIFAADHLQTQRLYAYNQSQVSILLSFS